MGKAPHAPLLCNFPELAAVWIFSSLLSVLFITVYQNPQHPFAFLLVVVSMEASGQFTSGGSLIPEGIWDICGKVVGLR